MVGNSKTANFTQMKSFFLLFSLAILIPFQANATVTSSFTTRSLNYCTGDIIEFSNTEVERTNETKQLRFQKMFYALKQLGLKDYFSKVFSEDFRQRLFRLVSRNTKSELNISAQTQNDLNTIFNNESES